MDAPLQKVELQADVYMVCLQHALSTENYEVMGLLIGDVWWSACNRVIYYFLFVIWVIWFQNVDGVTKISAVIILRRSDKKKDRVEISPDQLLKAAAEAESLTEELNKKMRVVGWYHSHPHITVCPSHVGKNQLLTTYWAKILHGWLLTSMFIFRRRGDPKNVSNYGS